MKAAWRCAGVLMGSVEDMDAIRAAQNVPADTVLVCCLPPCDEEAAASVLSRALDRPYRIICGGNPEQGLRELCAREGMPLETCRVWRDDTWLEAREKTGVLRRVRRAAGERFWLYKNTVESGTLCRVSESEKQTLKEWCASIPEGGPRLLIVSQMAAFDKGSCMYLKKLLAAMPEVTAFHLSETPRLSGEELGKKLSTPFHRAAYAAFPLGYPPRVTGSVPAGALEAAGTALPEVKDAVVNLSLRFPELGRAGAEALSLYLYELESLALEAFRPDAVLVWNEFTAAHMILTGLCREKKIPVIYLEFGLLPGTMNLDLRGQMGESVIAAEQPKTYPEAGLAEADRVLDYLKTRRMNRNDQFGARPGSRVCLPEHDRPVITLIGQNDYESGICPWNEQARRDHSPWFGSSEAAARELAAICGAHGWRLVYRPHPAMNAQLDDLPAAFTIARGGDLFGLMEQSDLIVTLMSQVAYEACIHDRPVLTLGRCQITGKGCCYERMPGKSLEEAMERALKEGRTDGMRDAFRNHAARLLDGYLLDNMEERELRYGAGPEEAAERIRAVLNAGQGGNAHG